MVKLYVADISNLPDPLSIPELLGRLPEERQQRIHNMKQEKSRKQSMGVGLLLQKVLALYHMQDSQVFMGEHGKPRIEGLEFNLSHSGDLVVCAVSEKPVGCDVEELREAPKGVVARYYSDAEQAYLSRFSADEYDREFFRLWTMKESYVKMTGEGLGVPFETYKVVADGECASWSENGYVRVLRNGEIQGCHMDSVELQGHIISICAEECVPLEVIWENLQEVFKVKDTK